MGDIQLIQIKAIIATGVVVMALACCGEATIGQDDTSQRVAGSKAALEDSSAEPCGCPLPDEPDGVSSKREEKNPCPVAKNSCEQRSCAINPFGEHTANCGPKPNFTGAYCGCKWTATDIFQVNGGDTVYWMNHWSERQCDTVFGGVKYYRKTVHDPGGTGYKVAECIRP